MKPKIGIIPGDPSGIGPELIARLLNDKDLMNTADILLIGDRHVFESGQQIAGLVHELHVVDANKNEWQNKANSTNGFAWHEIMSIRSDQVKPAEVSEAGGKSVLQSLDLAMDFAQSGVIDAIMFAPFNKASLHMAGMSQDDELHYMAEYMGVRNYISELNTLDGMWTSRVTSHIALKDVAAMINEERICEAVDLINNTLKKSGMKRPKISVAAINPHAGDGGNFGREEIDIIAPAVQKMADKQMCVDGPWPSDTVFLKAVAGEIDAVVTMYHDQGQIALKLLGFDRGVTVQGGLPFPVATPAHGTAFDIAGQSNADVGATKAAFKVACNMVSDWR